MIIYEWNIQMNRHAKVLSILKSNKQPALHESRKIIEDGILEVDGCFFYNFFGKGYFYEERDDYSLTLSESYQNKFYIDNFIPIKGNISLRKIKKHEKKSVINGIAFVKELAKLLESRGENFEILMVFDKGTQIRFYKNRNNCIHYRINKDPFKRPILICKVNSTNENIDLKSKPVHLQKLQYISPI